MFLGSSLAILSPIFKHIKTKIFAIEQKESQRIFKARRRI